MPSTTGRFKRIWDRTDAELQFTIDAANAAHKDFWTLCAGIDAYFEQRKRKEQHANIPELMIRIAQLEEKLK